MANYLLLIPVNHSYLEHLFMQYSSTSCPDRSAHTNIEYRPSWFLVFPSSGCNVNTGENSVEADEDLIRSSSNIGSVQNISHKRPFPPTFPSLDK